MVENFKSMRSIHTEFVKEFDEARYQIRTYVEQERKQLINNYQLNPYFGSMLSNSFQAIILIVFDK